MRRKRRPFQIGSVIKGRYEIVRKVGQGGFGIVYKARERTLRRFVAIKTLRAQSAKSVEVRQRFVDEARKLAKIDSQYVVKVHNTGGREGVRYFVMEFVPFSVDKLIHQYYGGGPVDYGVAGSILKQKLSGLSEIHRRKWTHRDIKPENILLTPNDEVKLADFGLIKDPSLPRTNEGANPGTPGWMAPEQRDGGDVSSRTDVYAFGLVACRMISGKSWSDIDPIDLALFADRGTAHLFYSCLAERPSDRPKDAREVLRQWKRIEEQIQKKKPRPPIRNDALVGNVRTRMEREYGLPQGSVKLVYPGNTRAVRADVRISRVRQMWGE